MEKKKIKYLEIPHIEKRKPPEKDYEGMTSEEFNKLVDEFDLEDDEMKRIANGLKKNRS